MALLRDDQPVVVVVVAAGEEELVQVGHRLLDPLRLQILQPVDELQQHETHVLLELVNSEALAALLQILGKSSKLEHVGSAERPNNG